MKKSILRSVFMAVLCLAVLCPCLLCAAAPLDTGADAGMTVYYQKDGKAFPDLEISVYRVARANADGTFSLIWPYSTYPVNIHGVSSQQQWRNIATTLAAYITAHKLEPDVTHRTDEQGVARFDNLQTGLYLVREVTAEDTQGTYVFENFMIYLPTPQPDGSFDYDVQARPKCADFVPKTQYTVNKLWRDSAYRASRPEYVTVEIYKDSVLQEKVILSADNNWSYTWYVSADDRGKWTVVETDVPDAYKVTIQQNGSLFSIVNTREGKSDIPKTGDSFHPLPWILAMCVSGLALVILAIFGRRRK